MTKNYFSSLATNFLCGSLALCFTPLLAQKADLGLIQKADKPIKYVALGGSLSAGVKDGGICLESQLSSFPNLLAKQMGLTDFKQGIFEGSKTAGTGKIKVSLKNEVLQFSSVTGSAFNEGDPFPKISESVNNMSIPYLKVREISVSEDEPGAFLALFDKKSYRHLDRYVSSGQEGKSSFKSTFEKTGEKTDFFTWELGIDDFVDYYSNGAYGKQISFLTSDREGVFPENDMLSRLVSQGSKGVIANVPNVLGFPYYQFYSYKQITPLAGSEIYVERYDKNDVRVLNPNDLLLPTKSVARLLTGVSITGRSMENPLPDEDVIGYEEQTNVDTYNSWINMFAKNNGIAVVDLYGLYEKILSGEFISHDGVKIDPSFPGGNFFSEDGITPSSKGQAVIANEFIVTINRSFGASIPLINIASIK